jgi:hypothetical protein
MSNTFRIYNKKKFNVINCMFTPFKIQKKRENTLVKHR